ncbi:MAG TPA: hypothetical protein DDW78_10500 [Treponema sp.]|nr:hypothetical protein [Treponema sp.]
MLAEPERKGSGSLLLIFENALFPVALWERSGTCLRFPGDIWLAGKLRERAAAPVQASLDIVAREINTCQ